MNGPYDHLFKFIVIGDTGVGKTSLQTQFTDRRFEQNIYTIGVDFAMRTVALRGPITGSTVTAKLQIWDSAGQERFRTLVRPYYRNATAALIVFDITCRRTFENMTAWIRLCRENEAPKIAMSITIVGNKTDLEKQREVPREEAEDFAKAHDLRYIETSAKTLHSVDDAFVQTARAVLSRIESGELDAELLPSRSGRGCSTQQPQRTQSGGCMC